MDKKTLKKVSADIVKTKQTYHCFIDLKIFF